jgi:hypothetical protein
VQKEEKRGKMLRKSEGVLRKNNYVLKTFCKMKKTEKFLIVPAIFGFISAIKS